MEVNPGVAVRIADSSAIAQARRLAADQARQLNWDDAAVGRAELIATEIATNILKHASDGCISLVRTGPRLQVLAIDRGQGIAEVDAAVTPGFSTAGTRGNGLPAIRRMARRFEIVPTRGKGAVVAVELDGVPRMAAPESLQPPSSVGAVSIARAGEDVCGDTWALRVTGTRMSLLVCDGLGHGAHAAEASLQARATFLQSPHGRAAELMDRLHAALRPTRGAAAAIAQYDRSTRSLTFCGIGNISGVIVHPTAAKHLVSHNGILGHVAGRIAEFAYDWRPGDNLIMHSDGLSGRWRPEDYPGLWLRSPAAIAGTLYRDFARDRDDATIAVLRLEGVDAS